MSFDMPPASANFEARGGWLANRLSADFGLTVAQACGIVGNLGFESGGFKELQEIAPVAGGAGGFGWAQWTGPRRTAFMSWCNAHGLAPASDEANYGFLVSELSGAYKYVITALKNTKSIDEAVFSVGQTYERPGGTTPTYLPGNAGRVMYAMRARAGTTGAPGPALPVVEDPVQAAVRALQTALGVKVDGLMDQGGATLTAYFAYRGK